MHILEEILQKMRIENMAKIDALFTKSLTFLILILNFPPPPPCLGFPKNIHPCQLNCRRVLSVSLSDYPCHIARINCSSRQKFLSLSSWILAFRPVIDMSRLKINKIPTDSNTITQMDYCNYNITSWHSSDTSNYNITLLSEAWG